MSNSPGDFRSISRFAAGTTKWILRQVLYRHVPQALIERPKMGFGVPLDTWLRGPLRDWAEALLDERTLREQGFFRPDVVRGVWAGHLGGRANQTFKLWPVLMFQSWLAAQARSVPSTADPVTALAG